MRILINTATTYKGGGVQVANSFIEECKKFDQHEYHIVLGQTLSELIDQSRFAENFTFYNIGYRPASKVFSFRPGNRFFSDLEQKVIPDAVFTTSGPAYWRPKVPHLVGYNLPHYIYPESPYFSLIPFYKRIKWDMKGKVLKYFFKNDADAYVVQTDDVNRRLQQWLKTDRVYTVSNTYSRYYENPKHVADKLPEKDPDEFRFLTLSAWYPHKNLTVIPKVIDELPEGLKKKFRFILTIPGDIYRKHFPGRYRNQILNTGPVKPEEGPALYRECDALFLPTLLECFSASYAEAMVMGKPIVTSNLGFARSICGNAALYVDPVDPGNIADGIKELAYNLELQERLVTGGIEQVKSFLNAEERAAEYLRLCSDLVNSI